MAPDLTVWRRMNAREQNRALCESGTLNELIETVVVPGAAMRIVESAGQKTLDLMNVSRAGVVNLNRRIYPASVMGATIERAQPLIAHGMLGGAVDHPGSLEGGVLKHSPIIWRELKLDSVTGHVQGRPQIVEGHSDGANLMALVRAGRALPFSTRGWGKAHCPTAAEKSQYGLKADDSDVVIIDEGFELNAIDAVDRPSCETAYMPGQMPANESRTENRRGYKSRLTAADIRRELQL